MKYLHLELDGIRLLLPAEAVGSAGPGGVRCLDGTTLTPSALFGLEELPEDAFAPAPWLPAALGSPVDALTRAPLAGRLAFSNSSACSISAAAWTAFSASSGAGWGMPKTAITPSPIYLSIVPPRLATTSSM